MKKPIRSITVAALAAAFCVLSTTRTAEASLSVTLQIGGYTYDATSQLSNNGSPDTLSFNANGSYLVWNLGNLQAGPTVSLNPNLGKGDIAVKVTITDNAPGGSSAELFNVSNDVRTQGGGNGTPVPLTITALENGYTSPIGNVTLTGAFSSTQSTGNASISYTSSVLKGSSTLASVAGTGTSNAFDVSGTYALMNVTSISDLNANGTYTTNGQSTVNGVGNGVGNGVVATPEPATLTMAIACLPVAGAFAWRKRRKGQD